MTMASLGWIGALWLGCKTPPDAPHELEALANYLFEHLEGDADAMQAGVANLEEWLDTNFEEATEGYRLNGLQAGTVEGLEGKHVGLDGQVGAAVAYDIPHPIEDVIEALAFADPMKVFPDDYVYKTRDYRTDPDCYRAQTCSFLVTEGEGMQNWPLGLEVESHDLSQRRWVPGGDAEVSRGWMLEPAEVNFDWLELDQTYSVSVLYPTDGGTRRLDAGWVIMRIADLPVPEDMALRLAVDTMRSTGEEVTAYLDAK